MDNSLWTKLHGGLTHFPIALVMVSIVFDLGSLIAPENVEKSRRSALRVAGFYTLVLGALSSIGAVLSGLLISHGELRGTGNLARHHIFLWPAFGLLIGLAVWRSKVSNRPSGRAFKVYMAA